jgi:hypothetical protein
MTADRLAGDEDAGQVEAQDSSTRRQRFLRVDLEAPALLATSIRPAPGAASMARPATTESRRSEGDVSAPAATSLCPARQAVPVDVRDRRASGRISPPRRRCRPPPRHHHHLILETHGSVHLARDVGRPGLRDRRPDYSVGSAGPLQDKEPAAMPIQTRYLFSAAMDVEPAKDALFNEVYDQEHVPLIKTVPGVIAAPASRSRAGP